MKKAILFVFALAVMLLSVNTAVFSYAVPDLDRPGSVSVTMRYGDTAVPGGEMEIFRVADIIIEGTELRYVPTDNFINYDGDLRDPDSPDLALSIAAYIAQNNITGGTAAIDRNGSVTFSDVVPGLYMLIQTVAAEGYSCVTPFLVSLPSYTNGEYVYDIDVSAKTELAKAEEEKTDNNQGTNVTNKPASGKNTGGSDNGGNKLPQTGQLNWPIPILLVMGTALVLTGLILCFGQRKGKNEK